MTSPYVKSRLAAVEAMLQPSLAPLLLTLILAGCAAIGTPHQRTSSPLILYHQHLASPAIDALIPGFAFDADGLIRQMDDAGARRAVVLSVAYMFGDDRREVEDEEAKVRAENDWTAAQVAHWPDRLIGFCSTNPLRPYALMEFERCSQLPHMIGLKLHFGNSGVSLRNPEHLAHVQALFRAAQARSLPIVVHMRARGGVAYGREDAEIFLRDVLPLARDSVVQIAHLAGAGRYPDYAEDAMQVFSSAIAADDPRTRLVYFDLTGIAGEDTTAENGALIAERLRRIGINRALFGTDLAFDGNPAPREAWAIFRQKIPLTEAEFADIADNVAPYMR